MKQLVPGMESTAHPSCGSSWTGLGMEQPFLSGRPTWVCRRIWIVSRGFLFGPSFQDTSTHGNSRQSQSLEKHNTQNRLVAEKTHLSLSLYIYIYTKKAGISYMIVVYHIWRKSLTSCEGQVVGSYFTDFTCHFWSSHGPLQDFWAVVEGCPVIAGYMFLFFCCLLIRKSEDWGEHPSVSMESTVINLSNTANPSCVLYMDVFLEMHGRSKINLWGETCFSTFRWTYGREQRDLIVFVIDWIVSIRDFRFFSSNFTVTWQ